MPLCSLLHLVLAATTVRKLPLRRKLLAQLVIQLNAKAAATALNVHLAIAPLYVTLAAKLSNCRTVTGLFPVKIQHEDIVPDRTVSFFCLFPRDFIPLWQ